MGKSAQNFCQRFVTATSIRPHKVAMTMLTASGAANVTFESMLEQIRSIAYRLTQENLSVGDRVAIIGENHPNWAIAYLGILYIGAVVTPLDPAANSETVAKFLVDSDSRLAFVSPSALDRFRIACTETGHTIPAIVLQPLPDECGLESYEDWASTHPPPEFSLDAYSAKSEDLALLMYTSGTTGKPKAVPLTHGNICAQIEAVEEVMKITDREVVLSVLPLYHAYSQVVNLWLAATIGARVVYLNEFGSAEIEQGLRKCGATVLIGVPKLWYLFQSKVFDAVLAKKLPIRWAFNLMLVINGVLRDVFHINAGPFFFRPIHRAFGGRLRLAVSGGARFDKKVAYNFHKLGFTILQGYGLTETSGAVTATRFEDNVIGSVGTPLPGVEVRIDEPNENDVGEVLIRGPIVTAGYYHNSEATEQAFTSDGWFRSGDLGRLDREGHLYIIGRKKDVIILPNGKNVYPEDLEAHYERSPSIGEICVLGIADQTSAFFGVEKLFAVVVPNFDYLKGQITDTTLLISGELEKCGRDLPTYQRVRDFVIREHPLPRTSTRKIRREDLRREVESLPITS
jgi:long-chain acyl-CoA synthetase